MKNNSLFIQYRHNRLSRRLLFYVVLCSTFLTVLTTGFQLYMEYTGYCSEIDASIRFIRENYIKPVADNAFRLNKPAALNILGGILKLHGIVYAEIVEAETGGKRFVWVSQGDSNAESDIEEEFPLIYENSYSRSDSFGILKVSASMESVYQRLHERLLVILISNAVKTFVASLCILFIIQSTVTRHLISIADYTKKLDLNRTDQITLKLSKTESFEPDELDSVAAAINEMRLRISRDMAAQKQAQETLRESEEKYRTLFNVSKDAIFLHYINPETGNPGHFLDANEESLRWLEYSKEELLQLTPSDIRSPNFTYDAESLREKMICQGYHTFEMVIVSKSGMEIPAEANAHRFCYRGENIVLVIARNISERLSAQEFLRKANDRLEQEVRRRTAELVAVNEQLKHEIEQRRRTEEALKKSEIRLNEAQQIAYIGSYERNMLTDEGCWSDEYYRIFGYEPEEVPCSQAFFYEHLHPEERAFVTENIRKIYAEKASYEFHFRFIRKDGEIRFGHTIGKIKADKDGHLIILSGTLQDITARVKMEAMLLEKQAQIAHAGRLASLGEMASGIAHELNQPLSIIRLNAEGLKLSLKRNGSLLPRYESDLKAVMAGVDRAADIIEHMRGYARSDGSDCEHICLSEPADTALMFFKEQFRNHEIELETHYEDSLPKVFISSQRFEQVAVNLLSNARYAVDKRKEKESDSYQKKIVLQIRYDKIRNAVVFSVTDNGIGMNSEEQKRCPEPFFTTKEVGEGTGLGLSIVHGIIKEFKGFMEIESEKGLGTTVRIIIGV
ncbi:MAG: hypothetical protein BWK80_07845 [Desulfobacteraceae bacterium IS3]|nr:MAG: hypothetical protein BWK80_07845 [Desulfobacteraceae bacterium IS3]